MMRAQLLYLTFKKHKLAYILPIVGVFCVVPLIIYLNVQAFGISRVDPSATTQMLVPVLSTWWLFLALKEYIEGDGVELLYAYLPKNKTKFPDVILLFIWYSIHVIILHFGLSFYFGGMYFECIRSLIQCYFFMMSFYALIYFMKSTSISYMVVLVYYFMTTFFAGHTIFEKINIFSEELAYPYLLTHTYSTYFLIASGFALLGYFFNRKFYRLLQK